jgi:hypothetical protein
MEILSACLITEAQWRNSLSRPCRVSGAKHPLQRSTELVYKAKLLMIGVGQKPWFWDNSIHSQPTVSLRRQKHLIPVDFFTELIII